MNNQVNYAGFWVRFLAYLIDIIPIVLIVGTIHYLYFGFDQVFHHYLEQQGDMQARIDFLKHRNVIRDTSLVIWLIYSFAADFSVLQGTLGKRLLGIKATDLEGNRLTPFKALVRNVMKIISFIPLGIGAIWAAFTKKKQAWHDLAAKSLVVRGK